MAHPKDLVARVKGALMAGLKPKVIAHHTGVPVDTIEQWASGESRATVEADSTVAQDIREVLLGRFNGSFETR